MKILLITLLLTVATVATAHNSEQTRQSESQTRQLQCVKQNQTRLIAYIKCLHGCLNRSHAHDKIACNCPLPEHNLRFCGH